MKINNSKMLSYHLILFSLKYCSAPGCNGIDIPSLVVSKLILLDGLSLKSLNFQIVFCRFDKLNIEEGPLKTPKIFL